MAVIDQLKVTISVDRQDLQEYEDDYEPINEPNTVTRYVEAQSGKHFSIRIEIPKDCQMTCDAFHVKIQIDGTAAARKTLKKNHIANCSSVFETFISGSVVGGRNGEEFRPWLFYQINQVEDSVEGLPLRSVEEVKEYGSISVSICRVRLVPTPPSSGLDKRQKQLPVEPMTLREKEVNKGGSLSHTTSFGQGTPIEKAKASSHHTKLIDSPNTFVGIFKFKYRSRHALQCMLLIPRTPSPTPLEEMDVNTLNADQMRELLRRQQERARDDAERKQRIKREIKEEEDQFRTNPAKRAKVRPFAKNEFIDLDDLVD